MTSTPIRVGIVGTGNIAYVHEAGYSELGDLTRVVAMCDVNEEIARSRAAPYDAKVYADYRALVADPDIDMVDITVPHNLHYPIALAALAQGKHVLVEKPIAMNAEQARELIDAARAARVHIPVDNAASASSYAQSTGSEGVKFTVAENTHFVAAYREAERLLRANALGDIRFVRAAIAGSEVARIKTRASWVGSAENRGVLLDSGVHSFYLLKWLFGGVRDIQAFAYQLIPESVVDDHTITIGHLANGAPFETTQSCVIETPWTERLEIHGSKGSLIIDQLVDPPVVHFNGPDDLEGTPITGVAYDPLAWKFLSMLAEVRDFVQAIIEDRPPLIDPLYGLYAVQVAEAAYRSIREGKAISIPSL